MIREFGTPELTPQQLNSLEKVDFNEVSQNDKKLRETSIDKLLDDARERIVDERGVRRSDVEMFLEGYERRKQLISLLYDGYNPHFDKEFEPSRIKGFKQSPIYKASKPQCNHAIAKLVKSGRVVVNLQEQADCYRMGARL